MHPLQVLREKPDQTLEERLLIAAIEALTDHVNIWRDTGPLDQVVYDGLLTTIYL